jgi:hypothetical protein
MLVYGHRAVSLNTRAALRAVAARLDRLPAPPQHDTVVDLLVDWGSLEAAVADALLPECDEEKGALDLWRGASDAIADAVVASWSDDQPAASAALLRAGRTIAALITSAVPDRVMARTAEGFAHYALFPEQYIAAAEQFLGTHRPASVRCLGLRSIGSILAHVVAATLRRHGVAAETRSVRPRGHPFDRRLNVGLRLRTFLAPPGGASHFAIVDEGPGISGSSFACAAELAGTLGFPPSRVVLFPSWPASDTALRSDRARVVWQRHVRITADFDAVWLRSGRMFGSNQEVEDLSAGKWRSFLMGDSQGWPAVQPQHERRKYLLVTGREPIVHRFAGLGSRGAAIHRRARLLADEGFCAEPQGVRHGFLRQRWIHGVPLTLPATAGQLQRIAAYVAFVKRHFGTGDVECVDDVCDMARTNAREALGEHAVSPLERLARTARRFTEERVAVDGRLLPHEWIAGATGMFKVDALDHHDDDFWPGCRDIAWDVAGAITELKLTGAPRNYFVAEYQRRSADRTIRARLPFYEAAYLAYRTGYATMAGEALGNSADAVRFTSLQTRYRRSLAARLACGHRALLR